MQQSSPEGGNARYHSLTPQRPTLPMPPPATQTSPSHGLSLDTSMTSDGSTSPLQPTWSPISPTSPQPGFQQAEDRQEPPLNATTEFADDIVAPKPLNLDESPDAIALRNAISILQIQRQQSIKDIQSLERLRQAALDDPQGFLGDLKDNKLASPPRSGVDVDDEDSENEDGDAPVTSRSKFGTIPKAQNVVRCPPVNWDKYHIIGESLDKLHEQQRRYPGITEAQIQHAGHPPKHEIAAPYRPGVDKLDPKVMNAQRKTS